MFMSEESYVKTGTFGTVLGILLTVSIAVNGFMWNTISQVREENIKLQGEIQTVNAKILPAENAITRTEYELSRERQRTDLDVLRRDTEERMNGMDTWRLDETKKITTICASMDPRPYNCAD